MAKRWGSLLMVLLCMYTLAACARRAPEELDIASFEDLQTGEIFSLGMPKERFDATFGEGDKPESSSSYEYLAGELAVRFEAQDKQYVAEFISISCKSERLRLKGFDFPMREEDVPENFALGYTPEGINTHHYTGYYNRNGEPAREGPMKYVVRIYFEEGEEYATAIHLEKR